MDSRILTYKDIDWTEWSRLVQTSATGTWFQSPEAFDFFREQKDLFKPFVVALEKSESRVESQESRELRGVCVGYVTKEKSALKQFFSRRAIIIGGPCLKDDCTDEEVIALMTAVKSTLLSGRDGVGSVPIYIETRNFNDYSRWKDAFAKAGFDYKPHLNYHIDPHTDNLSENRHRQIRKVQSQEPRVKSQEAGNEAEIREWYGILSELYRTKVKRPLWPVDFFLKAYRQDVAKFLLVKHEGKVIGGTCCVMQDGRCVYEWFACGRNTEYKEQYPSVMATYAGITYAQTHGYARYDMMGAGEPGVPYGVRDYKSEFGGRQVEYGRFLCICKPMLYKLGTMGLKLLKHSH